LAKIRQFLILTVAVSSQNRNRGEFVPLFLFLDSSCLVACIENRHRVGLGQPGACSSGTLQNHQLGEFELSQSLPSKSETVSDLEIL
jgi:hypothetical protein